MLRRRVGKGRGRPAFTLIELLVVVAIIALLISILLPSLARARELSKRSVCQSNLKGMGTSFYTYGNENADMWPIAAAKVAATDGTSPVTYVNGANNHYIGYLRGKSPVPVPPAVDPGATSASNATMSTARNLWTLVKLSIAPPKSFNCPSDTDSEQNQDPSPQDYWDFGYGDVAAADPGNDRGYRQCSYGYQVPYTTRGKPCSDRDQRMPLAADRGPYSPVYERGMPAPTVFEPSGKLPTSPSDDWKTFNSPNHGGFGQGEGQNVLYAGGSADWQSKSCCGIGYDMIYCRWIDLLGPLDTTSNVTGYAPGSSGSGDVKLVAPLSDTDSMIYP